MTGTPSPRSVFVDPPFDPDAPPYSGDERAVVSWLLDHHRHVLLRKLDGITEADARRTVAASDLTLLGLARHLALVEQYWFGHVFLGAVGSSEEPLYDDPTDPDRDFHPGDHDTLGDAVDSLRDQIRRARRVADERHWDDVGVRGRDDEPVNLRWIMVHLIEEYARHCGHADLLREAIDGSTGD